MTAPHGNDNRSHVARRELKVNHNTLGRIVENPKCLIQANVTARPNRIQARHFSCVYICSR